MRNAIGKHEEMREIKEKRIHPQIADERKKRKLSIESFLMNEKVKTK